MSVATEYKKLQSIYDSLDSNAPKAALQTCNKLLKKNPKSQIIRTLKSLALVRTSRIEEGAVQCDEILKERPVDDDVLSALTFTLRHIGRHEDIVNMYEDAFRRVPHNEELGVQTFFALVRVGSWKTAQQVSLKLSKLFPSNSRYIFWSATSAYLQACDPTTASNAKPVLLALALRMLSQLPFPSDSLSTPDKLYLHLEILLSYNEPKLLDAFDLLNSERGKSLAESSLAIEERRREIWLKLSKFAEEKELGEKKLGQGDRNWLTFLSYVHSVVGLCSSLEGNSSASMAKEALSYLSSLASSDGEKERGAHLAVLELFLTAQNLHEGRLVAPQSLTDAIKTYFGLFSHRACCFEDLKPYVDALVDEEKQAIFSFLCSQELPVSTVSQLQCTINSMKLARYIQRTPTDESAEGTKFFRMYLSAFPLGGGLSVTELHPADDLALLAANCFVQSWTDQSKRSPGPLHQAMFILEFASQHSAVNYQIRLLLIRIYILLGAYSLALQHYKKLNVKSVQNDTLSHFLLSRGSSFSLANNGDLSVIQEALQASQIYQENLTDTPEQLTKLFRNEKYSQIPGFILFEDRLDRSLQRSLIRIEQLRMRLPIEPPTPETLPLEVEELDLMYFGDSIHHDNRDYTVLPNYQRCEISIDEQLSIGPRQTAHWYSAFLKVYLRAINRTLDPTFSSPTIFQPSHGVVHDFTEGEHLLERYSDALGSCLWPTSNPHNVEGTPDKYSAESKRAFWASSEVNGKGINDLTSKNAVAESPSATLDDALQLVDELVRKTTESANDDSLPWEVLHLATLVQETFVLFNIQSQSLGPIGLNGKQKRSDPAWPSIKAAKARISESLKTVASLLQSYVTSRCSEDPRAKFVEDCKAIHPMTDDERLLGFATEVSENYFQSHQAMFENMSKGIKKVAEGKRADV